MNDIDTTGDVRQAQQTQLSMQYSGYNYMNMTFTKTGNTKYDTQLMADLKSYFVKKNMTVSIKNNVAEKTFVLHVDWA